MSLMCTGRWGSGGTQLAVACRGSLVVGVEEKAAAESCRVVPVCSDDALISCLTLSPSGCLLALCSEDKTLRVWATTDWALKGSRVIPKRATAVVVSRDEEYVIVADKTGEVWQYSLNQSTLTGSHLLGHFSMLLDMVIPSCATHVITSDRDEKIRVSNYPNSYNIESYCLGHKEFVSTLCLCDQYPHLLLSGSGDGSIRVWSWRDGRLLHTEHCPSHSSEPLVVVQLACSHGNSPLLAAILESLPEILLYNVSANGQLSPCRHGNLEFMPPSSQEPWSCAFDWSDQLWVSRSHPTEPLLQYQLLDDELKQCSLEESPLLSQLCKWEQLKGDVSRSRSFKDLKKHTFDNMSAYLARKEERIRDQKAKKSNQQVIVERDDQSKSENPDSKDKPSSDDSNHSLGQSISETGDSVLINAQPPEKKMKSDDTSTIAN